MCVSLLLSRHVIISTITPRADTFAHAEIPHTQTNRTRSDQQPEDLHRDLSRREARSDMCCYVGEERVARYDRVKAAIHAECCTSLPVDFWSKVSSTPPHPPLCSIRLSPQICMSFHMALSCKVANAKIWLTADGRVEIGKKISFRQGREQRTRAFAKVDINLLSARFCCSL
ncbi:hypothetical protein PENSPDRAFT_97647 [Peniophora sp. CONT]|nr:hypothetical protein PENSPDRAFT_97647 [Peniophora sp. CONT]